MNEFETFMPSGYFIGEGVTTIFLTMEIQTSSKMAAMSDAATISLCNILITAHSVIDIRAYLTFMLHSFEKLNLKAR